MKLIKINICYSDLSNFEQESGRPIGVGFVYKKSDGEETRDWYIVRPDEKIDYCRNDIELRERGYIRLVGTHKGEIAVQ